MTKPRKLTLGTWNSHFSIWHTTGCWAASPVGRFIRTKGLGQEDVWLTKVPSVSGELGLLAVVGTGQGSVQAGHSNFITVALFGAVVPLAPSETSSAVPQASRWFGSLKAALNITLLQVRERELPPAALKFPNIILQLLESNWLRIYQIGWLVINFYHLIFMSASYIKCTKDYMKN